MPTNVSAIILSLGIGLLFHLNIELFKVRGCQYDCILSQDGDYPLDELPLKYSLYIFLLGRA